MCMRMGLMPRVTLFWVAMLMMLTMLAPNILASNPNDVDADGVVDEFDVLTVWMGVEGDEWFFEDAAIEDVCDVNDDGVVDGLDYESVFRAAVAADPSFENFMEYSGFLRDLTYTLNNRTSQIQKKLRLAAGKSDAKDVDLDDLASIYLIDLGAAGISSLKKGDFEGLTGLESLYLGANAISDIQYLALRGSGYSEAIRGLTRLKLLDLSENNISNVAPLNTLTTLEELKLSGNNISSLSPLNGLTSLRRLAVAENNISDLKPLKQMTSLSILNIAGNTVDSLAPLLEISSLDYVAIDVNTFLGNSETVNQLRSNGVTVDVRFR